MKNFYKRERIYKQFAFKVLSEHSAFKKNTYRAEFFSNPI